MKSLESLALRYNGKKIELLDQQMLPHDEVWVDATTPEQMIDCIKKLKVRGAPLIGVAASVCLGHLLKANVEFEQFKSAALALRESRPTAVNLMVCVDRILKAASEDFNADKLFAVIENIFTEDVDLCEKIASHGETFIADGDSILTHCNTGGLATAGIGTALGVIRKAHESGKKIHVYVDETRPLLQGGRLTTWELEKLGIPYTLICDNMAASLIRDGKIQKAIVGADRIALNGDFANKVGTYNVALLCNYHKVPFFVAAPYTTVDKDCVNGDEIPIEQRKPEEVKGVYGNFGEVQWAPKNAETFNPAFDVTPAEFVSAWVLDAAAYEVADIKNGVLNS